MAPNPELERFRKDAALDPQMVQDLDKIGSDPAALVEYAHSKGYTFATSDLDEYCKNVELTDEQLEAVSGGLWYPTLSSLLLRYTSTIPTRTTELSRTAAASAFQGSTPTGGGVS